MIRSAARAALLATALLGAATTQATPVVHTLTLTSDQISDTPFGLVSIPAPLQFEFAVDDSILVPGASAVYETLPGFELLEPIVIGDATFTGADIPVAPGGRVTDGVLVEIFLLAQLVDPVEGQRELRTYFSPAYQWDGTDFNPEPPSEFVFGTYGIARGASAVTEPATFMLLGLGLTGLWLCRRGAAAGGSYRDPQGASKRDADYSVRR